MGYIIKRCCVCQIDYGKEEYEGDKEVVSHGYCKDCFEKTKKEWSLQLGIKL